VDPVSIIVAALAAGAAAGVGDAAKDVVSSLYGRLKTALIGKAANDPGAGTTLERQARDPEGSEAAVRDLVVESGAHEDEAIVALAEQLLKAADPSGAQVGKYNVQITGSKGVVIGDNANVTQTFN
jgi:hypothetical protein